MTAYDYFSTPFVVADGDKIIGKFATREEASEFIVKETAQGGELTVLSWVVSLSTPTPEQKARQQAFIDEWHAGRQAGAAK